MGFAAAAAAVHGGGPLLQHPGKDQLAVQEGAHAAGPQETDRQQSVHLLIQPEQATGTGGGFGRSGGSSEDAAASQAPLPAAEVFIGTGLGSRRQGHQDNRRQQVTRQPEDQSRPHSLDRPEIQ
jgi:hypothetical protein